jgi:multiple sugar transport system permease protein
LTPNLAYAIATLALWLAWVCVGRAAYLGSQLLFKSPGLDRNGATKGLLLSALLGAAGFVVWLMIYRPEGGEQPSEGVLKLPLVWFVMPFVAWASLVSLVMVVARAAQAWLGLNQSERYDRAKAAAIWLVAGGLFFWLFKRDPENTVEIFRGSIPFRFETAVILLLLVAAGMCAMVVAARWSFGRGLTKTIASQAALVAGSIVFGLPFAFLVITSFKEDRDMSSAQGIVWIPRVQDTVPFMDPKNPLYTTVHNGTTVEGTIIETRTDGTVRLEVEKPRAIGGTTFDTTKDKLTEKARDAKVVSGPIGDQQVTGMVVEELEDGSQRVQVLTPVAMKGQEHVFEPGKTEPVRHIGLKTDNYPEALSFLPPETNTGLVYLKNTLLIVIFSVIGTILSSSIVAYAFSRMKFPGRDALFMVLLSTMMLPAAVTMLPQFLIFRTLGWVDTLYPLWVPAFFASAFNVFLLRQFFMQIPMELEDASKIDGASYLKTFWSVMLPQIKPALAVIAIWTFMGAWNNFMGPLIYINSPENMPLSYALQLFQGDRGGEPGLLMAFATLTIIPVLLLFFFAQRYFIEGVTLSGLGGR